MKEVHYLDWLSNPVMVKKHDSSWRMCVDFKDLNKACPIDRYLLPEIDWKVESLCGFLFKCFLDAYKGYHQIQKSEEDEEKTAFITSQGVFFYIKMPFGLQNAEATYQRLVDKAFLKQIGINLEVYVDDLVIKSHTEEEIVCPDKVDAVLSLSSLKYLKDAQKLNGKLASLNRFLAKSAEKSLSFFKTLKKCTKKSDFHWTTEAKEAFKQMKWLIAELPMLVTPMEREELIPIQQVLSGPEVAERLQKWSIELGEYVIHYRPRMSVKGKILADFIVEQPEDYSPDTLMAEEEELPEPWILFTDGSSCTDGSGAGLILTNPEGIEFTYALRFRFDATNNEALISRIKIKEQMGTLEVLAVVKEEGDTWMPPIFKYLTDRTLPAYAKKQGQPLQANYVLREIYEGSCTMHACTRSIVAKALQTGYYWPTMHKDAKTLIRACQDCQVHKPVPRNLQQNLTPITSPWPFYKLKLPEEIISDNKKKFQDDPFKDWYEKLCIRQHFTSVKHPQNNGLVKRANRSLGEGIKARLDARSKNRMKDLPHVLWAHRIMIKSSNRDIPFSLTYETEEVIPAEISIPMLRLAKVDLVKNNEALEIKLDLLEEKREEASICEAKSKAKMEKYHKSKVQNTSFKLEDLVYRNNDASQAEDMGKLGPKWEGPYEVTEALGKGAYKLRDRNGKRLPRT
nr:reverse transcriptase domain-containing protein [Tanacetum cinerariifolium]